MPTPSTAPGTTLAEELLEAAEDADLGSIEAAREQLPNLSGIYAARAARLRARAALVRALEPPSRARARRHVHSWAANHLLTVCVSESESDHDHESSCNTMTGSLYSLLQDVHREVARALTGPLPTAAPVGGTK